MTEQTKCCRVCGASFAPDHRVGDRQTVCSKASCQRVRKRRSQAAWVKQNPDYFKGRYPNTKEWLAAHPGYLQDWRRRACVDIQDELTLVKSMTASELHDIQDELTACFEKHWPCADGSARADVQDELRLFIPMIYLAMIYKARLRL